MMIEAMIEKWTDREIEIGHVLISDAEVPQLGNEERNWTSLRQYNNI